MKREIFSALFALVLVLGLILAMAVPAGAVADHLEMVTQPGNTTAGDTIAGPPAVKAVDADTGDPVPGVDIAVTEIGHGYTFDSGTLTQTTNEEGIATFDDLVINTPDTGYRLQFSAAVYGTVDSDLFDVTPLNEVWVDDDTGDDGNPGTQASPFATIQKGVDNVATGGTVHVLAGTYNETNIEITKTLTVASVSGDWHDTTLSITGDEGFMLEPFGGGPDQFHEDFTVSGLTITGGNFGIDIDGLAAGNTVTISNCHIYDIALVGIFGSDYLDGDIFIDNCVIGENGCDGGSGGIQLATITGTLEITDSFIGGYWDGTEDYLSNSTNGIVLENIEATASVLIDNNIIAENGDYGIYVPGDTVAGELTITDNIIGAYDYNYTEEDALFTGNGDWGILIAYVTGDGVVTIEDNKLAENGSGIRIEQNYGESTISNNYVGSWTQGAITYDGNDSSGIIVDNTNAGSLLIQGNNISKNGFTGIYVANNDCGAGEVTIDNNTIDDNGTGGYGNYLNNVEYATISNNTITRHTAEGSPYSGIYLLTSSYNTISGNTINENDWGIYIDSNSSENEVLNNTIQDNNIDGIWIDGDENEIMGNDISGNTGAHGCGVTLWLDAVGNVINYNNITGNTLGPSNGVQNDNAGTDVDATNNWWGDASGPQADEGQIPDGGNTSTGDKVSNHVHYDPWLTQEWSGEVWVDDDWEGLSPGDAADGHIFGADAFASIQEAIDAVPAGTTINVAAGEYEEYVYVDKSLTLQGAGAESTFISAPEDGDGEDGMPVVCMNLGWWESPPPLAETVVFDGFTVYSEEYLIVFDVLNGSSLTISNNILHDCGVAIYCPADTLDDSSVTIEDNEIYDALFGIGFEAITGGSELTIQSNNIYDCWCGIGLKTVMDGSEAAILNNTINENKEGIYLGEVDAGSTVTIGGNTITNNISEGDGDGESGIDLDEDVDATSVSVHFNNIYGNLDLGIFNNGTGTLDARWNWWNTATGPYHETNYPDGEGDEVSDNVNCGPWLTAPVTGFASQLGGSGVDGTGETGGWVNITGGTADTYIAQYGSNPGSTSFSGDTGKYIDVMILNPAGVTEIEIRLYYTDADLVTAGVFEPSLRLRWWDGDSWEVCSDSGVNTTSCRRSL